MTTRSMHETWVLLLVTDQCEQQVRQFLISEGMAAGKVRRNLHLTLYYARREMPSVKAGEYPLVLSVPSSNWRMMALAPGGENKRDDIQASRRSVGIRVQRTCPAAAPIFKERSVYAAHEGPDVIGARRPSDGRKNAFGSRHFQPHISLLRPDAGHADELKPLGDRFRAQINEIAFDRVVVRKSAQAPI
jgi:hypothetical protein